MVVGVRRGRRPQEALRDKLLALQGVGLATVLLIREALDRCLLRQR